MPASSGSAIVYVLLVVVRVAVKGIRRWSVFTVSVCADWLALEDRIGEDRIGLSVVVF